MNIPKGKAWTANYMLFIICIPDLSFKMKYVFFEVGTTVWMHHMESNKILGGMNKPPHTHVYM